HGVIDGPHVRGPAGHGELGGARTIADGRSDDLRSHTVRRAPRLAVRAAGRVRLEGDNADAVHQEADRVRAVVRADVEHEPGWAARGDELLVERVDLRVPAMKRGGCLPRQRELAPEWNPDRTLGEVESPACEVMIVHLAERVRGAM